MKFLSIFLFFCGHFLNVLTDEFHLLNYVCDLTQNILTADSDTKDVAIGYFNSKLTPEFFSRVVECASIRSIVVTSDYSRPIENKHMRKAHLVILLSDFTNGVKIKN